MRFLTSRRRFPWAFGGGLLLLLLLATPVVVPSVSTHPDLPLGAYLAPGSGADHAPHGVIVHPVPLTWVEECASCSPGPRSLSAMAYDPDTGQDLLFGGENAAGALFNDTWAFQNGNWTQLSTPRAPSPRSGASMAFDPDLGEVVLFGGLAGGHPVNDTWAWNGQVWTNLSDPWGPSPRWGASLAWDGTDDYLLLFGGCLTPLCSAAANDTWYFSGGNWTEVYSANFPSSRGEAGTDFDASTGGSTGGKVVLFGGYNGTSYLSDTWAYANDEWTEVSVDHAPPARALPGGDMAYLSALGESVLFGGWNGTSDLNDTWVLSSGSWDELEHTGGAQGAPANYSGSVLAPDPQVAGMLLYGGSGPTVGAAGSETWVLGNFPAQNFTETASLSADHVDSGVSIDFVGNATGGNPPYSYAWTFGDGSGSGSAEWTHTYTSPGNYTVLLTTTDADDRVVATSSRIEVASVLSLPALLASSTTADVGQTLNFTAVEHGGTAPFRFTWSFGDGQLGGYASRISHAYASPGIYEVSVEVSDAGGEVAEGSLNVTVLPAAPIVLTVSAAPTAAFVGEDVNFTATESGGTGPLRYTWDFGDGELGGYSAQVSHAYAGPGLYEATVEATDATGRSAQASVNISVSDRPTVLVTVAASPSTPYVGQPVELTATATGGVVPYQYTWAFGDGTLGGYAASVDHTYLSAGSYVVSVEAVDAQGAAGETTLSITVAPAPLFSAGVTANATLGATPLQVGFTSSVTGGVGPYGYNWSFGDGATSELADPVHTYTVAGAYTATLVVTDALGQTAEGSWALQALQGGGPLTVSISASESTFLQGNTTLVSVAVAGGRGAYTLAWSGLPSWCTNLETTELECTPPSTGTYTISATLVDGAGDAATSSVTLHVVSTLAPPPTKSSSPITSLLQWPGVVLVVLPSLVAAALAGALVARRGSPRRRTRTGPAVGFGGGNPWLLTDPSLRKVDPATAPPLSTPANDTLADIF